MRKKIVKDNPLAADLWPYFRKANADYKANREKLLEKPEPIDEPKSELALNKIIESNRATTVFQSQRESQRTFLNMLFLPMVKSLSSGL